MWINRTDYEGLRSQVADFEYQAKLASQSLDLQRIQHRSELRALLRRVHIAEQQAVEARSALELERHENREAERHWANALLRAKQSFPQPSKQPARESMTAFEQVPTTAYDAGELAALEDEALRLGIDPARAKEILLAEAS